MKTIATIIFFVCSLAAYADTFSLAKRDCMKNCNLYGECCNEICNYSACIAAQTGAKWHGIEVKDGGAWAAAMAACQPHLQILMGCVGKTKPKYTDKLPDPPAVKDQERPKPLEPDPQDPKPPVTDDWSYRPEYAGTYFRQGCAYNIAASGKSLSATIQCEDGRNGSIHGCKTYISSGHCQFTFIDKNGVTHSGTVGVHFSTPFTTLVFLQKQPKEESWTVWDAGKK